MNKKFFIYCNDSKKSQDAKKKLTLSLRKCGCTISPEAENVVVLGGDGTFVHAYNTFAKKNVKMVLINTGLVGFYSIELGFDAKAIIKDKGIEYPIILGNKEISCPTSSVRIKIIQFP